MKVLSMISMIRDRQGVGGERHGERAPELETRADERTSVKA